MVRRFLRAIFEANAAYENEREQMAPVMAEWSGTDEKVILAAAERMNPSGTDDEGAGAEMVGFHRSRDDRSG